MSETKYAYRIPPCSKYDIAGMESWLEDMAEKGLYLDKDGLFMGFATFVHGRPQRLRFRLEATVNAKGHLSSITEPDEETVELHRMMGWDYRGRWGQFHIYATPDPSAPELHTDPRVQALTIQALNKFQRSQLISSLETFVILYFFHGSIFYSLSAVWGLFLTALAIGWALSFPITNLIHLMRMIRLKNQLKKGIPMTHRADWKKQSWRRYTALAADWIIGIVLVGSLLTTAAAQYESDYDIPLENWTQPFPFASVQELFPDHEIRQEVSLIDSEVHHWSNWLANDCYDYTEWREVVSPEGETFSAYIQVWYYETRYEWFARGLARELAQQFGGTWADRFFTDREKPKEIPGVDADYAVYYDYYRKGLILCDGTTVIRVHYNHPIDQRLTPEEVAHIYLDSIR